VLGDPCFEEEVDDSGSPGLANGSVEGSEIEEDRKQQKREVERLVDLLRQGDQQKKKFLMTRIRELLTEVNDEGGLLFPSLKAFKLCVAAEVMFQEVTGGLKKLTSLTQAQILEMIFLNFCVGEVFSEEYVAHASEKHGPTCLETLCKWIVKKFLRIRVPYYNDCYAFELQGVSNKRELENKVKFLAGH
jgi:hypothetical protein